jgi:serine/threonine-protein kinase
VEPARVEPAVEPDLAAGTLLAHVKRYEILRCIGEGGMGRVYQAWDPVLQRDVALKVMKAGVVDRTRFRREAIFGARFCHPSIVRVFDMGSMGEGEGAPEWFSMEYLPGSDMEGVVERVQAGESGAPFLAVRDVFRQILAALQYAHDCRVVHRDVKPANMFVARDPNTRFVTAKLLDFGVALDLDGPASREARIVGDPRYMAPEQTWLHKRVDGRADVYAAGLSLFEVLAGRHPFEELFEAPLRALIDAQRRRDLPRLSDSTVIELSWELAAGLDGLIARACAKDPGERFDSARAMQQALLALPVR